MLILLKTDSLHFRKISNDQRDSIKSLAEILGLVTTVLEVSFNVYGQKSHLFTLLYELSKSYDIEII